jgi:7-carboxy-7-deazaguanine synthase
LNELDFVKFVISNENDFFNAEGFYHRLRGMGSHVNFAFSPAFGKVDPAKLVGWMQRDRLMDCILSYQIHKLIWPKVGLGEER